MNTFANYESFFHCLERNLPAVFCREEAARQMGGILRAKTLSNLDAAGRGPLKVRIGKKLDMRNTAFYAGLGNTPGSTKGAASKHAINTHKGMEAHALVGALYAQTNCPLQPDITLIPFRRYT